MQDTSNISRYTSFILLFVLCIHLTGQDPAKKIKIVAFGNSTTAERKAIHKVYAQRLPDLLKKYMVDCEVINCGVGGSHTGHLEDNDRHKVRHALDRLQPDVLEQQPDLVIMQFGINDSYVDTNDPESPSRISVSNFRKNMTFIIDEIKKADIQVILLTPNPFGSNKEQWRHQRLESYVEVIRELAMNMKIAFIDVYALYREYDKIPGQQIDDLLLDGVHPNDKGHEILAEKLVEIIYSLYLFS